MRSQTNVVVTPALLRGRRLGGCLESSDTVKTGSLRKTLDVAKLVEGSVWIDGVDSDRAGVSFREGCVTWR